MGPIGELLMHGGPFAYLAFWGGLLHGVANILQWVLHRKVDWTLLLWFGLGSLVALALVGSTGGVLQAARSTWESNQELAAVLYPSGVRIALVDLEIALLLLAFGLAGTGLSTFLVRRHAWRSTATQAATA